MTEASGASSPPPRPAPAKGPAAFRTISEASAELGVPPHVLRFWETRFAFVRPTKRAGGRRFYRPQDIQLLRGVRVLLQEEGFTIRGVQKLHKEGGLRRVLAAAGVEDAALAAAEAAQDHAEQDPDPGPDGSEMARDAAVAAPPPPARVAAESDDEGEDGPETGDLFGAIAPPRAREEAGPPQVQSPAPSRPVLDPAARLRLEDVLDDLEAAKAEIDVLLRDG